MRLLTLLALLLAGCALPDQRSFNRTSATPGGAEVARAALPARPLVTIRLPAETAQWRQAVLDAVAAARDRKPDVVFDVMAAVPTEAVEADRVAALRQGSADARLVATVLGEAGVPPDRLRLGAQGDPGRPPREVRIYVR